MITIVISTQKTLVVQKVFMQNAFYEVTQLMVVILITKNKRKNASEWKYWALFGVILAVDIGTKLWAKNSLHDHALLWKEIIGFSFTYNTGIGFSLFQNNNMFFAWLTLIVTGIMLWFYASTTEKFKIPTILILAGAVGNIVDRFSYGYVIDFVKVWHWPIFNVADAALSIGVMWALYLMMYNEPTLEK